jgi:hypothetical protein
MTGYDLFLTALLFYIISQNETGLFRYILRIMSFIYLVVPVLHSVGFSYPH